MSGTSETLFSGGALLGYFLSGTVYLLLPAAVFLWMRRYGAARIYPVIVGVTAYYLSVRFSDIFAHMIGFSQPAGNQAVIAAEMVCILEEAARWLAMRWQITDIRTTRAAVCYGIGHGGLECWIRGVQKFQIFHAGQQVNAGAESAFSAARLAAFADHPLWLSLLDCLESAVIFGVQIALSLLIFRKMTETHYEKRWLLCAILLHYLMNGSGWLASLSGDAALCSFVGIVCGGIVIWIVCRLIRIAECMDEIRWPLTEEQ